MLDQFSRTELLLGKEKIEKLSKTKVAVFGIGGVGSFVVEGLSILGGEPMNPKNIDGTTKLAKSFKEKFPNKNLWAWSGYLFDKDLKDKDVVKYLDVLVDGQYVDELHNPTLKWKGSANQRVIDVQKSLEQNNVVLL